MQPLIRISVFAKQNGNMSYNTARKLAAETNSLVRIGGTYYVSTEAFNNHLIQRAKDDSAIERKKREVQHG